MFMPYGRDYLFAFLGFGRLAVPQMKIATNNSAFFMIHIGQLIRQELDRQERTPTWLARKINCERPNVYYIFSQPSINTDMLLRISQALNHDFFQYYTTSLSSDSNLTP